MFVSLKRCRIGSIEPFLIIILPVEATECMSVLGCILSRKLLPNKMGKSEIYINENLQKIRRIKNKSETKTNETKPWPNFDRDVIRCATKSPVCL